MALPSNYYCSSDLESVFLDKLTGQVLAGGRVEFYIENSNTPKNVYITTGSPPSSFVPLGSTVTLDSIGQYSDGVNSVVVYYYPFNAAGELELYRVKVYSSDNILQFTREAWPPIAVNLQPVNNADTGVKNYIPNGQFLSHNNNPVNDTTTETGVTISNIAQGGWSFKKTTVGTGVYAISFVSNTGFPSGLQDYPPFAVNINCTSFNASDTKRDLTMQWPDVNIFSRKLSGSETNPYNLFFKGKLNSGSSETFSIYMIRNFGTGGSATIEDLIGSVTVNNTYSSLPGEFNVTVYMPDNSNYTVGPGSFISLSVRGPTNTYNVQFTDFVLTLGASTRAQFPVMTNDEQLSRSVTGYMPTPNPDGSDLYLPLRLTPKGIEFDHSEIGSLVTTLAATPPAGNLLPMDGTGYLFTGYNASTGIPYSRLGTFLTNIIDYYIATPGNQIYGNAVYPAGIDIPLFGSGESFVNAYGVVGQPTQFDLVINEGAGIATIPTVGDTGWGAITNSDPVFTFTVGSVPTAGKYFTFTAPVTNPVSYYVWFTVNGAGNDPAPGGTGIVCALTNTETTSTVPIKIMSAINQYMWATYDISGFFMRAYDATGARDTNYNSRQLLGILGTGQFVGTSEVAAFLQHHHQVTINGQIQNFVGGGTSSSYNTTGALTTTYTSANANTGGGTETRPVNFAVNYFIRY